MLKTQALLLIFLFPSCYLCQMLSVPNGASGKNTVSQCFPILLPHQVDFLPPHIGALCTASQSYPEGQRALLVFNFKASHSHLPQNISSLRCKQSAASVLCISCFSSTLNTAVLSSPSCNSEHTNFKESPVSFSCTYTKGVKETLSIRPWTQERTATNYQELYLFTEM